MYSECALGEGESPIVAVERGLLDEGVEILSELGSLFFRGRRRVDTGRKGLVGLFLREVKRVISISRGCELLPARKEKRVTVTISLRFCFDKTAFSTT